MGTLLKLVWVEVKLFVREPITVVFTLALPLVLLFVLGEVFGNTPDPEGVVYRGVGPMDFYVPAYVGLVLASIGVLALPVHLAAYRELGVLRRFRASSVPLWVVLTAHVLVAVGMGLVGGVILVVAAGLVYDISFPGSLGGLGAAFLLSALGFAAIGVLLGAVLPTARAAQGAGIILFFVMMLLGGGGPPREVMTEPMQRIGDLLPLTHAVRLLQDPWLGFGWSGTALAVVVGVTVVCALGGSLALRRG